MLATFPGSLEVGSRRKKGDVTDYRALRNRCSAGTKRNAQAFFSLLSMSSGEVKNCCLSYFRSVIFFFFFFWVTFKTIGQNSTFLKRTIQGTFIKIVVAPVFEELFDLSVFGNVA